jgi:hypothetical protein
MHQNLLNAEFMSVWYLIAENNNVHGIRVIEAPTKVLHICLPSIAFLGLILSSEILKN